jgi:hypothetical protein
MQHGTRGTRFQGSTMRQKPEPKGFGDSQEQMVPYLVCKYWLMLVANLPCAVQDQKDQKKQTNYMSRSSDDNRISDLHLGHGVPKIAPKKRASQVLS